MTRQRIQMPAATCGDPAMDALHEELFAGLQRLANSGDVDFPHEFAHFVHQVERTFLLEESWMDTIDFDGTLLHREQHARVLGALHHVHARVMRGEIAVGRDVVERLLPQWLSLHMETMDTALGISMQTAEMQDPYRHPSGEHHHAPAFVH